MSQVTLNQIQNSESAVLQNEADELLEDLILQKNIAFLNEINFIQEVTEARVEQAKKDQKRSQLNSAIRRKAYYENRISDAKSGVNKHQAGSSVRGSYQDSLSYYQSQLGSLLSSINDLSSSDL